MEVCDWRDDAHGGALILSSRIRITEDQQYHYCTCKPIGWLILILCLQNHLHANITGTLDILIANNC